MLGMDMPAADDFNHNQEEVYEHPLKANKEEPAPNAEAEAPVAEEQSVAQEQPKPVEEAAKPQAPAGDDSLSSKVLTPLVKEQLKFCSLLAKGLKRHPQGGPFLVPVDPVALGIPDYFSVITNPMDLSTIQRKLDAFEYETADQFADDVHLMLNNCFTYNKPETQVYQMGKALEKYFNNSFAKLPTELATAVQNDDFGKRRKSEAAPARAKRDSITSRRTSVAASVASTGARPKRSNPELTYCMAVWKELTKKSYLNLSWPFLEPVDPIKLGIPDYPEIIKSPMDLSTVKKKLDAGAYGGAEEFAADIRLIFSNCYTYNGIDSDVSKLGKELEAIFEKKLAARPAASAAGASSRVHDDYDEDSEKILAINKQIQALQQELNELLTKRRGQAAAPKAAPKPRPKAAASAAESTLPSPNAPMSFDEKRQLSIDVNNLSPEKLGRVVEIIHNSMPYLQQQSADSDVIELDIESLDVGTLRQLQKYINECKSAAVKKRKSASTGGPRTKKAATGAEGAAAQTAAVPAPALEEGLSSDDSSSSDDDI